MFQKINKKTIREITRDLEFYDNHKRLPYTRKKVMVTIPYDKWLKLRGKNLSKHISLKI